MNNNDEKFFDKRSRSTTLKKNLTERHKVSINGAKEKIKILHAP
jgi:hypothetical protein